VYKLKEKYSEPNGLKKRVVWYDFARFFAIVSITLNHAVNRSYGIGSNHFETFFGLSLKSSYFAAIIQVVSRLGVPIFLMLSGALLLNKKMETAEDVKRFYKHNLAPLFIATEIWLFIMYIQIWLCDFIPNKGNFNLISDIKGLILTLCFTNQKTNGSMWYMPMIMGIYLFLPMIIMTIDKIPGKYVALSCSLVFIGSYLYPNYNSFLAQTGSSADRLDFAFEPLDLFSPFLLFIIIGYYVNKGLLKKINSFVLVFVTLFVFALCCYYQKWGFGNTYDYVVKYNSTGVLIVSTGLFEIFRRFSDKKHFYTPFVTYISEISFGIYFVHICIMQTLNCLFEIGIWNASRSVKLIVLEVVSFALSIVFIWLFSKIKWCKKYMFVIKK